MNRLLAILSTVILLVAFAGCNGNTQSDPESSTSSDISVSSEAESFSNPHEQTAPESISEEPADQEQSETSAELPEEDEPEEVKVNLTMGDTVLTVTMQDNVTAQDFLNLLPLTLEMKDEMNREKYQDLPRALDEGGLWQETFEIGDFAYWPNGDGLVMFYDDNITSLHGTSIIVMGTIDGNVEVLADVEDPVAVTIALAE